MSTPEKNDAGAVSKAEVEPAVGDDATAGEAASSETPPGDDAPKPSSQDAPKPSSQKEVNRTIQLDLAQVDLLDVPLPPSSAPKVSDETSKASKGPPPLPPSAPPSAEASAPAAQVSARKLLEGGTPEGTSSPALRFALGLGAATLVCVGLWFGVKALRKPPPAPPPAPAATTSVPAGSAAQAPMRTITIAPIEMTGPTLGASGEASAAASAPSAKPAPAISTSARPAATHGTPSGSPNSGAGKPRSSDDVIKVEN